MIEEILNVNISLQRVCRVRLRMSSFIHEPGFCTNCGTILPLLEPTGGVTCYFCKAKFGPEGN